MINVIFHETGPWPKGMKRELPRAQKKAFKLAGNKWKRAFLKEHFKMSAMEKYGYRKRSKKYLKSKQNILHHQLPLVYSGTTRRRAKDATTKSTSKKGTVILPVQALNFQGFRAELTKATDSETQVLENTFVKSLEVSFNRVKSGKKITIK